MQSSLKTIASLLLTAALVVGGTSACHNHQDHDHEQEGHTHETEDAELHDHDHEHEGHAHGITLSPEKAQAAGVEVEKVMPATFHGTIHTSGRILAASCDETTLVAPISGRVQHSSHVSEGMQVVQGSVVYSISASGIQDGDPVQRASIEFEKAKREYERAETLVKDKIISEKDFALAKAEYELAHMAFDAIGEHNHSVAEGTSVKRSGGVSVRVPRSGFVKQCLIMDGGYVEKGQPLMIITQNQHLYLRAEVPERHFDALGRIVSAKFRTSYSDQLYDVSELGGHIQSYGRTAEQNSAYIPVTFEFNNTANVIQGSYADIYLITSQQHEVLSVPVTALTEEQGLHYIYIREDADEYRKQEVTLGLSDGERTQILSGLKGGEDVVVRGAVQVKLASASNAIPAHTHNH